MSLKNINYFICLGLIFKNDFFYELFNFVKMSYEYKILLNKKIDFKTYN